jgi:hypothetical protein
MFREIFCDVFVNPYNETIFVRVTDVSEETKQEILNVMKPPSRVTVVFLEAKYPYYKLEEWVENIAKQIPKMEESGIPWTSICIENGTILITLEAVKPEYVKAIVNLLKGKVPLDVITIAKYPRPKLLALTDRIRPLEAGIQVKSYLPPYITTSTLNFLVIDKATGKEGAIIAGHAGGLYEPVYQPTIDGENYIGSVSKNPPGPRYGDSAWVPLASGVDGVSQIYDPYIDIKVWSQEDYEFQYAGDRVEVESLGVGSGYRYGEILRKISTIGHPIYGTLYNQLEADFTSVPGDSGGPVYVHYYQFGIHYASAYGIVWGGTDTTTIYSPPDGIEKDFGTDLDFSGA